MVQGESTTVIQYELRGAKTLDCKLELRPLIAFRDFHSTTHENGALNPSLEIQPGWVRVAPYVGLPSMYLAHTGAVQRVGIWFRNFEYAVEQERGLDFQEDLFNPLVLICDLSRDSRASVVASTEMRSAESAEELRAGEIERREKILAAAPSYDPFVRSLALAADQFIVRRGDGHTVIAGYPWFGDWGRDTMITLPGLTLVTGRYDVAKSILLAFAGYVDRGMLPNRFPDAGEAPEYNT